MRWLDRVPLLPVLAGVVGGILAERYVPGSVVPIVSLLVAALFVWLRRESLTIILCSLVLGWMSGRLAEPYHFETLPDSAIWFGGVVTDASLNSDKHMLTVSVDKERVDDSVYSISSFRAVVTVPSYSVIFRPGDLVFFKGSYSYPKITTDLPMEDDMADFNYNRGVSLYSFTSENDIVAQGRSGNPLYALKRWREKVVGYIYRSGVNLSTAQLLSAIIAGDGTGLDRSRRDGFAAAGVAHVLALSGAHVAIIAAIISFLLFPVAFMGHRRMRWGLAICGIWIFAIMTGGAASVVRSSVMATVVLMSLMLDRPRSSLNSLCVAALAILLVDPHSLYMVGFQLSFMATLSIILLSERLNPVRQRNHRAHSMAAVFTVTIAATVGTLPLVAYHFHQIPLYFLPANAVAVVAMPLLIVGGAILAGATALGVGAPWLLSILDWVDSVFGKVVDWVASLPASELTGIYFSAWLLVPVYVGVILCALFAVYRKRLLLVGGTSLFVFSFVVYLATVPTYPSREFYILRDKHNLYMLVSQDNRIDILTTGSHLSHEADSLKLVGKYKDYIATRGISSVNYHYGDFASSGLTDSCGHVIFAGRAFKFAAAMPDSVPAVYCVADRRFKGDIVEMAQACNADTIVLTADIHPRRRARYASELSSASIPYIDASESAFAIEAR